MRGDDTTAMDELSMLDRVGRQRVPAVDATKITAFAGRGIFGTHTVMGATTGLNQLRFAVVDVETTGLSPRVENVIELGISVQQGGEEVMAFQSLIGPAVPLSPFITRLTGVRERDLAAAPLFADIVNAVAACFVGVDFAVAHNVTFDRAFLNVAFTECRRELPPRMPWIDPVPIARRHLGFAKLDRLTAHYGVAHEGAHRALHDARATAAVLYRLADALGLHTLAALQAGRADRVASAPATSATSATSPTSPTSPTPSTPPGADAESVRRRRPAAPTGVQRGRHKPFR